jgi:D-glycero-D-manno-heptose 1,7-bisphosphate phosphatase
MRKAIFLDRDGVINHDPGDYTRTPEEFRLLPGVISALNLLKASGFEFIVITNQGGIARGLYGLSDFEAIDQKMHALLHEGGIHVLETFFCPHYPDFGRCLCRKPDSLLVEKAIAKYRISAADSWMIGDKERDIQCAEGAGVRGLKISTNHSILPVVKSILEV